MINHFIYNGIKSSDLGVRIISKNIYSAPKYDTTSTSIPGRNGELISPNGRYGNVTLSYNCFVASKSIRELEEKITLIKNWLYRDVGQYNVVKDSYDEKFQRFAVFSNALDISDEVKKIGTFTIKFNCKPERYLIESLETKTYEESFEVENPYTLNSKPYFKIHGSGNGVLSVNNKHWQISDIDEYIEIDSEEMNCFKDTILCNSQVSGDGFPELTQGTNSIAFSGGITKIEIIERLVSL